MLFWGVVAVATFVGYKLYGDSSIRENTYTKPLSEMPNIAEGLVSPMIDMAGNEAENNGIQLDDNEIAALRLELYKMMSEGAVEQRNWEMRMTRDQISYIGQFLSWFLKQKGLTYAQIQEKYARQFNAEDVRKFEGIVQSASRVNPSVFGKLLAKVTGTMQAH